MTPGSLSFKDIPLNDVLHQLAKLAAINLHLDPKGLAEERDWRAMEQALDTPTIFSPANNALSQLLQIHRRA